MAIETICSGCAKKLRVGDEHAGKQARCPQCGTIYMVPQVTTGARSLFDDPGATAPAPKSSSGGSLFDDLGVDAPAASGPRSPAPFANPPAKDTAERWFMKIEDGREFGPVDRSMLDQWYAERRIGPTTQLRREHDNQWQPARNVYPALGSAGVPATAPPGANPFADAAPNPYASSSYAPAGASRAYSEPHRGGLILAFALLGWFVCVFFAVAAWVMGASDLDKMKRGQMDPSGEGLTRAGMIIGIIASVMGLIAIGIFMLMVIVGVAAG